MKAIGFDTSRVERGRRPRKKAAALLLQTRRLQSYPSAFMVGSESWLSVKFKQRAWLLCSLFSLHPSLSPVPLFEVNAARRLRANLNIAVASRFIG